MYHTAYTSKRRNADVCKATGSGNIPTWTSRGPVDSSSWSSTSAIQATSSTIKCRRRPVTIRPVDHHGSGNQRRKNGVNYTAVSRQGPSTRCRRLINCKRTPFIWIRERLFGFLREVLSSPGRGRPARAQIALNPTLELHATHSEKWLSDPHGCQPRPVSVEARAILSDSSSVKKPGSLARNMEKRVLN